jgi:tRNA pseudouridine55 synthase
MLLVDKPAGLTSHDVVARVRRATHTRRVGHTGTLDPFATGLLVLLIGRGTRLIPFIDGEPKEYEAVIRFGAETDTDDCTGTVTRRAPGPADVGIAEGIARLTGAIEQVPPAYSAKQVGGRRAYAAARRGEALDLAPAPVVVHEWQLREREGDDLRVRIACGTGTYIRALARDLGRIAGSAAHLAALRRVRCGPFEISQSVTLDEIDAGAFTLAPLRTAIATMPARLLDSAERERIIHGNAIEVGGAAAAERLALLEADGALVAVAERDGAMLRPRLVLADA